MLLTLVTRSLHGVLASPATCPASRSGEAPAAGAAGLTMWDLPRYAIDHLQLRGLNLPASALAGWSLEDMDRLRDRADKAGCPCLVLFEDTPLPFGGDDEERIDATADRIARLASAAHRLGCNALAIAVDAPNDDETFETVADQIKEVMASVERKELNLLLAPVDGLTNDAERLTDLIKRIGGFRIGSLPSFGHAASTKDPIATLRKLAPYAGAVHATVNGFKGTKHQGYDLADFVAAIRSVGFVNTLSIDFVGSGEGTAEIEKARAALQDAIDADA